MIWTSGPGRRNRTRAARPRGASILEMKLVFPILLMLSFGVVGYGYAMYLKNTLQGAASIGARNAIVSGSTNSSVTSAISSCMSAAGLASSGYTVTLNPSDVSTVSAGSTVTVQVTVTWGNAGTHMLGSAWGGIGNSKTIGGLVTMFHE